MTEPLDAEARRVAELVVGDARAARFLRGDSLDELLADAHRFATALDAIAAERKPKPPPPDFDGGARATPPAPSDPVRDHDGIMLELARRAKLGGPLDDPL